MKKRLLLFCFVTIFFACENTSPPSSSKDARFRTTIPSQLYFKNMRSFFYEESEGSKKGIKRFFYKKIKGAAIQAQMYPIIYENWLEDEAYIVFEKNNSSNFSVWAHINKELPVQFDLKADNYEKHAELAFLILDNQKEVQLFFSKEKKLSESVFSDKMHLADCLIVLADYKRLLDKNNK